MNMKNKAPQNLPKFMELKILGKVTKINPGPAPGSTPKEKQAGKIIRPAIRPTKVSSPAIQTASPVRDLSFG